MKSTLISLIISLSPHFGINPDLAVAVAMQESSLNPQAVGGVGEVGLFQVRPRYSLYNREDLFNPAINIVEGLRMLKFAKKHCKHRENYTFIICFNRGVTGGARVENPYENDYYIKVMGRMK